MGNNTSKKPQAESNVPWNLPNAEANTDTVEVEVVFPDGTTADLEIQMKSLSCSHKKTHDKRNGPFCQKCPRSDKNQPVIVLEELARLLENRQVPGSASDYVMKVVVFEQSVIGDPAQVEGPMVATEEITMDKDQAVCFYSKYLTGGKGACQLKIEKLPMGIL